MSGNGVNRESANRCSWGFNGLVSNQQHWILWGTRMRVRYLCCALALISLATSPGARCQSQSKLVLNTTRPFVYVEFDHIGQRVPEADDEPPRGLWLRLVNNSVFPILVRVHNSETVKDRAIVEDVVTAVQIRRIPKEGFADYGAMPTGYASALDVAGSERIGPGKVLLFSVPINHVAPTWYFQVPFQFDLPPTKHGAQPVCYVAFEWDNIPEKSRWVSNSR
jgi:hypothetical protein